MPTGNTFFKKLNKIKLDFLKIHKLSTSQRNSYIPNKIKGKEEASGDEHSQEVYLEGAVILVIPESESKKRKGAMGNKGKKNTSAP